MLRPERNNQLSTGYLLLTLLAVWLTVTACAPRPESKAQTEVAPATPAMATPTPVKTVNNPIQPLTVLPTALATSQVTSAALDPWLDTLQKVPYPYTTPLPPPSPTTLDSIYAKLEPKEATPVPCRRCPDYLPEGGIWKLSLDRGRYHIFHQSSGWFSLGSFTVSGHQLTLFNDPTCIDTVGTYEWELTDGELRLKVIADTCQVNRRGRSFANLAWLSCHPPSTEAAVTDHWPRPAICDSEN